MGFLEVMTGLSVGASAMQGKQQQLLMKAQAKELEGTQRANTNATEQALKDKQREEDMNVYQQQRQARRAESLARASQANSGIAGITANRQLDNVVFQNIMDINYIKTQGDNALINISNQGYAQGATIQSKINETKRNTPSNLSIAMNAGLSGVKTYGSLGGFNGK